jgi:hypothetical protein
VADVEEKGTGLLPIRRMTATEKEAMLRLNVALEILDSEPVKLRARLAEVPYSGRDLGLLKGTIHRLMKKLTKTIPADQLPMWIRTLETACYTVGNRRPATGMGRDEKSYGIWVSFDTMRILLDGLHDRCLMCALDGTQRRACPLKKALDTIPNDAPRKDDGDCQYYTLI